MFIVLEQSSTDMYNVRKTEKQLSKRIFRKARAVSPVVATLILIIVAIVGAIAVGLIVSRVSTDTGNQANVGGASNGTQAQLLIGGSTTVYPVDQAAIPAFEAQYHVNVIDTQGGSDAGMQGVISGSLDIGVSSSAGATSRAQADITNNGITGVTLNAVQVGGSGVVVISSTTALKGSYLTDGSSQCVQISKAALLAMYTDGAFYIATGACSGLVGGAESGMLEAACVVTTATSTATGCATAAPTTATGPYQAVSRSDSSGTADTFAGYLGIATTNNPAYGYPLYASDGANGNPGVLTAVQTCTGTVTTPAIPAGTIGCIGFVDLGFAEGNAAGVACAATSTPCKVSIAEITSNEGATADAVQLGGAGVTGNQFVNDLALQGPTLTCTAANQDGAFYASGATLPAGCTAAAIAAGTSTAGLHNFIKTALISASHTNPLTGTDINSATGLAYPAVYPDASASGTGLVKVFFEVTNGPPSPVEEQWISFITSPNAQNYFDQNGFFSFYEYTAA
jgi:ABC-type phosphate transport system substrate-binding protein